MKIDPRQQKKDTPRMLIKPVVFEEKWMLKRQEKKKDTPKLLIKPVVFEEF